MKNNRIFHGRKIGFTLTEILIVVVIMGLLGTLALPVLVKTIEKAKFGEAISNLNLIRTGEKIYFLQYSFYAGRDDSDPNPKTVAIKDKLNIEDPNTSPYFTYTIESPKGDLSDFTVMATRKSDAPSAYAGKEYTISKDGVIRKDGLPFSF